MKQTKKRTGFVEDRKTKRTISSKYIKGITKTLLEKYKPSETLTMLDGGKEEVKNLRAA